MATQIQPVDLLDLKTLRPAELRTAEWAMVDQWTRERAFYMAGVMEAETLQEMRDLVRLNVTGQAGEFELLKRWEAFLDRKGYTPAPGTEGTIKDLRSLRRFNTALRVNTALLHEWAAKENDLRPGPMRAFPAWELVRLQAARMPRDWPARWVQAGGVITAGERMIAGKLDPVWAALGDRALFPDALGVDYPPFAWGSGMGRTGVGARECMDLGILTKEDINASVEFVKTRPLHSPSEDLQVVPKVTDRALREDLAQKLGGLAEWQGSTLIFTDPNGTRPMTQAELLRTWSRPLPEKFRTEAHPEGLMQKDALAAWVTHSADYENAGGTDRWEDLWRLGNRLVNTRKAPTLYRGLQMSPAEVDAFLAAVKANGYGVRERFPAESWTDSEKAAERYARGDVLLQVEGVPIEGGFKEISELVRALVKDGRIDKQTSPPVTTESEWILLQGVRLVLKKVVRPPRGPIRLVLEPQPRAAR